MRLGKTGSSQAVQPIKVKSFRIRSWQYSDAESLAEYAHNFKIWINLKDAFPFPYTLDDAKDFIEKAKKREPESYFAIDIDGEAAGSIGFVLHSDVKRVSAEIGYWLGEPFWGQGIMTNALKAVTEYAITTHQLSRVYAAPYEWNPASCRVLEKAGYALEARMKKSVIKDGKIIDQFLYACTV